MPEVGLRCLSYDPLNWCWASVTEAVVRHYRGPGPPMCDIVNWRLNRQDCCPTVPGGVCDVASDLDTGLQASGCLETRVDNPVAPLLIRKQIVANRPLCAFIEWDAARLGHFVIITGFDVQSKLWVIDPQTGPSVPHLWDYEAFRYRYRDLGKWKATFLTKPAS